MEYQQMKTRMAKMLSVNGDDHRTVTEVYKKAVRNAEEKESKRGGLTPEAEMRLYDMPAAFKLILEYIDQEKNE